ncbi:FG-GAP-like repeat-containing protein, partial [Candidatus Eisenbacteria bacterium]
MRRATCSAAGTMIVLAAMLFVFPPSRAQTPRGDVAAELDHQRLLGKAYYENDKFAEAGDAFRRCIELAPESAVDRFNLGLVQMRAQEYEQALESLARAQEFDPELLAAYYVEGIIHKRQMQFERAAASLQQVIDHDPSCRGAYYNLGVCFKGLQQYEDAVASFLKKVELSPDDPSTHYQLISLYRRIGDVERAERHKEIFARVKDTVDESEKTAEALERSKYSDILEAPRLTADLPPRAGGDVRFHNDTARAGLVPKAPDRRTTVTAHLTPDELNDPERLRNLHLPKLGGDIALADYDQDGDLDIYLVYCHPDALVSANQLWRNNGDGTFAESGADAGVADSGLGTTAIFGDYDNDGLIDLYVANCGPNVLYRNAGDGTFEDVSADARVNEPSFASDALFVDFDHDNDLDIFVCNDVDFSLPRETTTNPDDLRSSFHGMPNTLLRNRGDGIFTPHTDAAGLLVGLQQSRSVVPGDFDSDYDTDLFVLNADAASTLFVNTRFGRFVSGGTFSPELTVGARALADGDFNHDGFVDLILATPQALLLYLNNGRADFTGMPVYLPESLIAVQIASVTVLDYNNDGWSDLLLAASDGPPLTLLAGAGGGRFADVSTAAGLDDAPRGDLAGVAAGDLDNDGDEDLVTLSREHGLVLLRNETETARHWLKVRLLGKKVNRSGYGASVEVASGGHYQKQTYTGDGIHFGIGELATVDVVRVTWPNGVAQNVVLPEIDGELLVEEYVKVSASCAFLYAFNGRSFELINEILGIGPLGVPISPGVYHQPDNTELTKIEADQLVARDGFFELRLTEELREITFADMITLRVVDHPADLEIVPNEMFVPPPFPEDKLFAFAEHRHPRAAFDDQDRDVLELITHRDGRFPAFPLTEYHGLALPHSLTIDLGDLSEAEEVFLCLDAWIYWAESSTVMA